jgi:ribosomal protein S18 acetylase RimI-like enzyme
MRENAQREGSERTLELRDGRVVQLRRVQCSDTERFLDFFEGLSAQSRDFMHGWTARCDRKHAESITAEAATDDYYALVATVPGPDHDRIVGYSWINGIEGPNIPMLGIGIVDAYHDVGLGSALLRQMLEDARRMGLEQVKLGVWADNARAVHVYESVGFRHHASLPPKDFDGRTEFYLVAETGA